MKTFMLSSLVFFSLCVMSCTKESDVESIEAVESDITAGVDIVRQIRAEPY